MILLTSLYASEHVLFECKYLGVNLAGIGGKAVTMFVRNPQFGGLRSRGRQIPAVGRRNLVVATVIPSGPQQRGRWQIQNVQTVEQFHLTIDIVWFPCTSAPTGAAFNSNFYDLCHKNFRSGAFDLPIDDC